jgi:hypothetical protein
MRTPVIYETDGLFDDEHARLFDKGRKVMYKRLQ